MLSVAIMAHPSRERYIPALRRRLPGAEVVWDEKNDRWDTGRRSIMAHDPDAKRHLIVQDDAILSKRFLAGVREALEHVPEDSPASFYLGKTMPHGPYVDRALRQAEGKSWLAMRGPWWGVAIALPVHQIQPMVEYCDLLDIPNYDRRMSRYFEDHGIECWYSLPSLVDHRVGEENPSLVHGRGATAGRVAHSFAVSTEGLRWDRGALRPQDLTQNGALWFGTSCRECDTDYESVPEVIMHYVSEHGGGRVDMVASTEKAVELLAPIHEKLSRATRGTLWCVGVRGPGVRVRRNAARRHMSRTNVLTIIGNESDITYTGHRPVSLITGERVKTNGVDSLAHELAVQPRKEQS